MAVKCLCTSFAAAGTPIGFVPSTDALYKNVRSLARERDVDGRFPELQDEGTYPTVGLAAVNAYGVRPSRVPGGTDISEDPEVLNAEPTLLDEEEASKFVPVGDLAIEDCSYGRPVNDVIAEIVKALTAPKPMAVGFGTFVDSKFMNHRASDPPMGACNLADPYGGGHAISIMGHRTESNGTVSLLVDNSWGPDWCDSGAIWVSPAFISQITDIMVWAPKANVSKSLQEAA